MTEVTLVVILCLICLAVVFGHRIAKDRFR